ncbi:hypothetical protein ACOME3_010303 [Neoechinorhynchus agilis]
MAFRSSSVYDQSPFARARSVEPYRSTNQRLRSRALSIGPSFSSSARLYDLSRPSSRTVSVQNPHRRERSTQRWTQMRNEDFSKSARYFDRYSELIPPREPKFIDGYYKHFRQYYWYHTAPRAVSYFAPFSDWRFTSRRTLPATQNQFGLSDYYNPRNLHSALSHVKGLQFSPTNLNYLRSMRDLRSNGALYGLLNVFDRQSILRDRRSFSRP